MTEIDGLRGPMILEDRMTCTENHLIRAIAAYNA